MRTIGTAIPDHIRQQLATQRTLDALLAQCMPTAWKAHCHAVDLAAGKLSIVADDPAWRARLHLHSAEIIRHFNCLDSDLSINGLVVRCGTPFTARTRSEPVPVEREIPDASARALRALADEIDDGSLADTLRRLAARGRDPG